MPGSPKLSSSCMRCLQRSGPWPRAASSTAENQHVRTLDPESSGAQILLNQGQWTYEADTRDLAATAPGLLPFVVHEAKCVQPKQRDPAARKRANEASIAAPWALLGYFLDPVLFEMLARTARLSPCSPLLGALHSSHFPCLMTFPPLPWLHPPSGLCGPCSLFMLGAPVLLSRTCLALGRRYPVVANPLAGGSGAPQG